MHFEIHGNDNIFLSLICFISCFYSILPIRSYPLRMLIFLILLLLFNWNEILSIFSEVFKIKNLSCFHIKSLSALCLFLFKIFCKKLLTQYDNTFVFPICFKFNFSVNIDIFNKYFLIIYGCQGNTLWLCRYLLCFTYFKFVSTVSKWALSSSLVRSQVQKF